MTRDEQSNTAQSGGQQSITQRGDIHVHASRHRGPSNWGVVALALAVVTVAVVSLTTRWWEGEAAPDRSEETATTEPSRECRPEPAAIGKASVSVYPCIEVTEDGVWISSRVESSEAVAITVFVWLREVDHEVGLDETLRSCYVEFSGPGEKETCEHLIHPNAPGLFAAATAVQLGIATAPFGWEDDSITGFLGGHLHWPSESAPGASSPSAGP
ncbi:hypothetical protein [Streptomyces sp. B6B3]|uniref:hypothetical protein n=1 Tax=Streptomyces sp. B6B3 TaxID=3153570 RepID=UPI00325D177D